MDKKTKEIEEAAKRFEIEYPDSDTMGEYIETLLSKIKELQESRDFWKKDAGLEQAHSIQCEERVKELEARNRELVEGIEKLKLIDEYKIDQAFSSALIELYKLVEKSG